MTDPAAIARARADAVLDAATPGDRLVVRAHDRTPGATGAVDALGDLVSRDADHVVIATRRGAVTIARADVVAAKPVPPPPAPRPRAAD